MAAAAMHQILPSSIRAAIGNNAPDPDPAAGHQQQQEQQHSRTPNAEDDSNHNRQHRGQFIVGWRQESKVDLDEVLQTEEFGHTNKLRPEDFELMKTLGTGMRHPTIATI
jgi:hypothetical protein